MKRTVCLFLAVLLLVTLFAGCRGKKPSVPASTGAPDTTPATRSTEPEETRPAETHEPDPTETAPEPVPMNPTPADPSMPGPDNPIPVDPDPTKPDPVQSDPTEPDPSLSAVTPMLFSVTDEKGREMFLFGTIHAGDERMGEAMDCVAPCVDICDALAVEFDIVAYEQDYQAQLRDMQQFVLTDGTTIEDHMPADLYQRAYDLLKDAKLFPSMMKSYNLAMWAQLVEQAAMMTTCDLDFENGMDRRLINYCCGKGIEVLDVESAEFQYGLLTSFPDELNLLLIKETLDNLDTYGETMNDLFEVWTRGDYDEILAFLEQEDEDETEGYTEEEFALIEDYNDKMLTQRNLGMRDRALGWMEEGRTVFFAVGAAHLVGEDGLVELLREAGCTVEQVDWSADFLENAA